MLDSSSATTAPHVFEIDYFDAEALAETVTSADIEVSQQSAGPFSAQFSSISFRSSELVHGQLNQSYLLRGTYPEDVVLFSFWYPGTAAMKVRGVSLCPENTLVVGQGGCETEMMSAGHNNHGTFAMERADFLALAESVYELPQQVIQSDMTILPNSQSGLQPLRETIELVERQALLTEDYSSAFHSSTFCEKNLIQAFLEMLSKRSDYHSGVLLPTAHHRRKILKKADIFLRTHQNEPVSLIDLSLAVGASKRSLQYAFQEEYDMSPMAYLRVIRLNRIRLELQRNDPSTTKVTDVALRYGCLHLGRFSAQYALHFGELPSATLRQTASGKA